MFVMLGNCVRTAEYTADAFGPRPMAAACEAKPEVFTLVEAAGAGLLAWALEPEVPEPEVPEDDVELEEPEDDVELVEPEDDWDEEPASALAGCSTGCGLGLGLGLGLATAVIFRAPASAVLSRRGAGSWFGALIAVRAVLRWAAVLPRASSIASAWAEAEAWAVGSWGPADVAVGAATSAVAPTTRPTPVAALTAIAAGILGACWTARVRRVPVR